MTCLIPDLDFEYPIQLSSFATTPNLKRNTDEIKLVGKIFIVKK